MRLVDPVRKSLGIRLTALIWIALVVAWTGMVVWVLFEQRSMVTEQARDFARTMQENTLARQLSDLAAQFRLE
ncbi:MAG TPA: hypothetical protein VKA48_06535 [Gammaproteobacteria bacterium]|nr:hypothetical protein [Gammaproteobacteria bacterium]